MLDCTDGCGAPNLQSGCVTREQEVGVPKSEQCLISVELANALSEAVEAMGLHVPAGDRGFLCGECEQPVKPHRAGKTTGALKRNPDCKLSHVWKG